MKKKLALISIVVVLIVILITFLKITYENSEKLLIKRVLEIAFVSGEIADYNLLKDKKNIVISTENIDPSLIPELTGIKLIILSPTEIKEKANKEGEFLYLRFKRINFSSGNANIALENIWASPDNSKKGYSSGGGMEITFHRFLGRWIEDRSRLNWIS